PPRCPTGSAARCRKCWVRAPNVPLVASGTKHGGAGIADLPTGTVTFLFTDIEDGGAEGVGPVPGTRLWEQHPQAIEAALARHDALAAKILAQHAGVLIKHRGEGDSLFAVFSRAAAGVAAAVALQRAFTVESRPGETPLRVRMVLHTGDASQRDS